ncbi:hypothetical protein L1987_13264 [Smallanthus sonchifolius]|uniref:Uncharacterized protein n=1 Tax=Smallanthus sonchifolius TaxID=185202 RepID=A0ACB9JG30_9ASTR|nr:hypothetical protein L1987_13264 [Smallanthus sonchifolius]
MLLISEFATDQQTAADKLICSGYLLMLLIGKSPAALDGHILLLINNSTGDSYSFIEDQTLQLTSLASVTDKFLQKLLTHSKQKEPQWCNQ